MKQLNRRGAEIMQEFGVRADTDIIGFGLPEVNNLIRHLLIIQFLFERYPS